MNTLDAIKISDVTTDPDISQLTTKSVNGTGVFDQLMTTAKLFLVEEYEAGRLSGQEYSNVLLGSIQSVLQQSVAYLMNDKSTRKIAAEIGLIRQKTVTELANTDNLITAGLGFNDSPAIEGLVASKLRLDALQETLATSQIEHSGRESALTGQKLISELARTDSNLTLVRAAGVGYNTTDLVAGAMTGDAAKSQSEADLTEQKVVTELAQTSTTKPLGLGLDASTSINGIASAQYTLVTAQGNKAANEIVLVAQKSITELAQTSDTLPTNTDALNTVATVNGVVSNQKNLYVAQTDGFKRDAEQKAFRIFADTWSVDATVGAAEASGLNGLDNPNILKVVNKVLAGIDA